MTEYEIASFGALLKTFRTRHHLTQQQLADAIGVHRNAIGRWEQGDFLPAHKNMVLELARVLHLDMQESRQLLEASFTAFAPSWSVPLPRNPFFTGREEILAQLHTLLDSTSTHAVALQGLGGVGKTQIVLEYAYRHALAYHAVFWISAETEAQIIASLLQIAKVLVLPEREDRDQQRVIEAVQRWLASHSQWLVIWDNFEDLALIDRFLPPVRSGAILLTTRSQALGTLARGLELLPMEQEEALVFLLRRAKLLSPDATHTQLPQFAGQMPAQFAAACELVNMLAGLPLALDQAGAYIEETGCGTTGYLQHYQQRHSPLLDRRGSVTGVGHAHSVTATFRLAYEQVEGKQQAANRVLLVCAFLYPDTIPEELFIDGAPYLGSEIQQLADDPYQFDQALALLRKLSLVQRFPETQTLSLHRLVQEVLREGIDPQEQMLWYRRSVVALNQLFPEVSYDVWKRCERLLPHVLTCSFHHSKAPGEGGQELALVLRKAADYLRERAQYAQAEMCYQQALCIGEQAIDADYTNSAAVSRGLAILYTEQGKYEQAEPLYQQALQRWKQVGGLQHPEVAHLLFRLANLYYRQGKYEQSEDMYQQSLHLREQVEGPNHPLVAQSLHGLAYLYSWQGKYERAEPLYRRALSIREQALDPFHPDLGTSLNGLANLYQGQGKDEQAEPLLQRALLIWKETFGPDHPQVASPLYSLALTYANLGKDEQAEPLYQQALHVWEQNFGPHHPNVASPLNGLANLYLNQGKLVQAEQACQRALDIWEQALGPDHPNVGYVLDTLASIYVQQGRDEQAVQLYQRALHIWEQAFGPEYPQIAATRDSLNSLMQAGEKSKNKEPSAAFVEHRVESTTLPCEETGESSEQDTKEDFFTTCCELHPQACCRTSDLWHAYKHWSEIHQKQVPLSRRAFATQVKALGCQPGRTSKARIWHGIKLVDSRS